MSWNILSMNPELLKQWEGISDPQKDILRAEHHKPCLARTPINPTTEVVVGSSIDSSGEVVEIYRSDVLQILSQGPITVAPIEKMLYIIGRYANQTYSKYPPYCIAGRYEEDSRKLGGLKVTRDIFFATSFIFIPFMLDQPSQLIPLLVVSPFHRTVELLDSNCSGYGIGALEVELLGRIFGFLAIHLGNRFNPLDWRLRRDAALQQIFHKGESALTVMSNAMAIAFGYEIPGWMTIYFDGHILTDGSLDWENLTFQIQLQDYKAKRLRAASELLHGCFEPYIFSGDDEMNAFAYRFGAHDYAKPLTTYRITRNGIIAALTVTELNLGP
ncbi:uncharacterized protein BP5553_04432 [Venustampulla echinocandica]|uniref:Uncharacterized protein n=1 Tax=Venustampulla echinocandica TaxID=2656787 RepID=A0A370TNA6_9HELO|nr:uncharacterized protein BP5553_04432 [Venustampulla echinocandica]RDL36999.1 hypothetical protein BP5553_04432 [Venustampulla echinocandica]